ncbi:MAG: DUF4065 domain-containing protein [Myxococcales bacterium]|nr:MAG: DUF4065 domain-containing protein [Myxococcales bacterium]
MAKTQLKISFKFDRQKAIQAILWFLARHGGKLEKLKLIKLIFFADREHLAKYARPIIGGSYVAMQHGPVLSELLNLINSTEKTVKNLGFNLSERNVVSTGQYDEDFLSESDIEALRTINTSMGSMDSNRLRNRTHGLKAWKNNYPDPSENTSRPLPYEDFFLDLDNSEILEIIRDDQEVREMLA